MEEVKQRPKQQQCCSHDNHRKWRIRFVPDTTLTSKIKFSQEDLHVKEKQDHRRQIRFLIEAKSDEDEKKKKKRPASMVEIKVDEEDNGDNGDNGDNVQKIKIPSEEKTEKKSSGGCQFKLVPKDLKAVDIASGTITNHDIWKIRFVPDKTRENWNIECKPHLLNGDAQKGLKMHFTPRESEDGNPLRIRFLANEDLDPSDNVGWEIHFSPHESPDDDSTWEVRFVVEGTGTEVVLVIYGKKVIFDDTWKRLSYRERCDLAKVHTETPNWFRLYQMEVRKEFQEEEVEVAYQ